MSINIIVHYSEIALKGKNRSFFEKRLQENIKRSIKGKYNKVSRAHDRIVVELKSGFDKQEIEKRLKRVFGIEWFAFVHVTEKNMEAIKDIIEKNAKIKKGETAKIVASRSDKGFAMSSMQI